MRTINLVAILLCGLSIGWLIGLTTAPVIQTVIGSILAILTTMFTIILGLQNTNSDLSFAKKIDEVNILPFSLFLIGLSISTSLGIYARTNEWLGVNPLKFKEKWEIKDKDTSGIIKNLYSLYYSDENFNKKTHDPTFSPTLFDISSSFKSELRNENTVDGIRRVLRDIVRVEKNKEVEKELRNCADSLCIINLKEKVLKFK